MAISKKPGKLFMGSMPIVLKCSEDASNKVKDLKTKIYHMAFQTILKRTYLCFSSVDSKKKETLIIL